MGPSTLVGILNINQAWWTAIAQPVSHNVTGAPRGECIFLEQTHISFIENQVTLSNTCGN
jgi:hypothetical protein